MGEYQDVQVKVLLFIADDMIRTSSENADDLGNWNGDWFSKTEGNGQ